MIHFSGLEETHDVKIVIINGENDPVIKCYEDKKLGMNEFIESVLINTDCDIIQLTQIDNVITVWISQKSIELGSMEKLIVRGVFEKVDKKLCDLKQLQTDDKYFEVLEKIYEALEFLFAGFESCFTQRCPETGILYKVRMNMATVSKLGTYIDAVSGGNPFSKPFGEFKGAFTEI